MVVLGGRAVSYERGTPVNGQELPAGAGGKSERGGVAAALDQIAFERPVICTGARQNPATCGANQGYWERRFDTTLNVKAHRL